MRALLLSAGLQRQASLPNRLQLPNFEQARQISARFALYRPSAAPLSAAELYALSLLHQAFFWITLQYDQKTSPRAFSRCLFWLCETHPDDMPQAERLFQEYFALPEAPGNERLQDWMLLWLANINPAIGPLRAIIDNRPLPSPPQFPQQQLIEQTLTFFESQPAANGALSLFDFLRLPMRQHPNSLSSQLAFILAHWTAFLPAGFGSQIARGMDFLAEENALRGGGGPGPVATPAFENLRDQDVLYSQDENWMPRLVLIAKNVYVWMAQLSQQFQSDIHHLDQIPDQALAQLAEWGFNGLWLIGVWERSPASQTIKQLCGNPKSAASAYSLYQYQIAQTLGGEQAFQNLKSRAISMDIRLGADMVPNHMGIDSPWVLEHPNWFLAVNKPPFPSYTFTGPDLTPHSAVSIRLEDHYFQKSDAAVVFQWQHSQTGETRYIYHGNDGTNMPWNDTAQLDYRSPEVREHLIQTIVEAAHKFPILRFDAAMTLAKKHYQRLWFPKPGDGGAIPSRAEHGLTEEQFNQLMPREFWQEVVERVAQQAPHSLLLAEAFWMMEGYFVRTLGMHRVYNSAFMHMLRDERNAEYQHLIQQTLEFDPQILKRYVNFMNNPDEETAIEQFGEDGKYFGVCTLLATLPGLPMFGHGQFEGLREKYGMEYYRPQRDEAPNTALIARHQREIVPLLKRRALFANVANFALYPFQTPSGSSDPNVFAFSNQLGEERALILYHNQWADTRGRVHRASTGGNLAEHLNLGSEENQFTIYRDLNDGLEYLVSNRTIHQSGLSFELGAYHKHVLLDFRQITDHSGRYAALEKRLNGHGIPGIEQALQSPQNSPLAEAFAHLSSELVAWASKQPCEELPIQSWLTALLPILQAAQAHTTQSADLEVLQQRAALRLQAIQDQVDLPRADQFWLIGWALSQPLETLIPPQNKFSARPPWPDNWTPEQELVFFMQHSGTPHAQIRTRLKVLPLLRAVVQKAALTGWPISPPEFFRQICMLPACVPGLSIAQEEEELYFSIEQAKALLNGLQLIASIESHALRVTDWAACTRMTKKAHGKISELIESH